MITTLNLHCLSDGTFYIDYFNDYGTVSQSPYRLPKSLGDLFIIKTICLKESPQKQDYNHYFNKYKKLYGLYPKGLLRK